MKKKFEILMVACLFISAFLLARASAALTSSRHAASSKTCIVLDAGHGGSDPGKVGCNDALEKDINLSIVLKLCLKTKDIRLYSREVMIPFLQMKTRAV